MTVRSQTGNYRAYERMDMVDERRCAAREGKSRFPPTDRLVRVKILFTHIHTYTRSEVDILKDTEGRETDRQTHMCVCVGMESCTHE